MRPNNENATTSRLPRPRLQRWLISALLVAAPVGLVPALTTSLAYAEDLGSIEKQLGLLETQARDIGTNIPKAAQASSAVALETQPRRLVNAQIAFRTGNYNDAAIILFDIVSKGRSTEYDAGLYYLAESLYQKGDRVAARSYFVQLNTELAASSKYQQQSLQRLVELAIELGDGEGVDGYLLALDNAGKSPLASYVRGKWQFARGQYDDALIAFSEVSRESSASMQAQYFTGTTHIAKKDLQRATDVFLEVVSRKPKSSVDRRIVEMSHLALGRLFYERDQPSRSVDWYLAIDRRSDLFADALFEAAWVYVKGKQFDKALSALELLSAQDPFSQKTPGVRILEGNLRIRKAQMLRNALLTGLEASGDPADEYIKAEALFADTSTTYQPSYAELHRAIADKTSPAFFMSQVTGRESSTFSSNVQLPEIAAAWIREEPKVAQVVVVETDLRDVQSNMADSERTIARLESLIANPQSANAYPLLAERRARAAESSERLIATRSDIADQQLQLVSGGAELQSATAARQSLAQQMATLPGGALSYRDRVAKAQADVDQLEAQLQEIDAAINEIEAGNTAMRVYSKQLVAAQPAPAVVAPPPAPPPAPVKVEPPRRGGRGRAVVAPVPAPVPLPPPPPVVVQDPVVVQLNANVAELDPELAAMKAEMAELRRDVELSRDIAGTADEAALQGAALRTQMRTAQDAEHRALAAAAVTKDSSKSKRLLALGDQAVRVASTIEENVAKIDAEVTAGLRTVQTQLATEKQELATQRSEFIALEAESREIGAGILATGFRVVHDKLYDVVVRSDVGNVDVSWSQKEDVDQDLKRFQLERTREVKQIRDEFRDVLDQVAPPVTAPPVTAPPAAATDPAPAAVTTPAPTGSPAAVPAAKPPVSGGGNK